MYLISFTGLFNWMRKTLQGQRTDTAFRNRVLFIAEARCCAYHHTNCLRAQKEKACQRPVCQHIMVPASETLAAARVRFCAGRGVFSPTFVTTDLMLNRRFKVYLRVCVTCRQKRQNESKQTGYNWVGTKLQGLQRLPGTTGDVNNEKYTQYAFKIQLEE